MRLRKILILVAGLVVAAMSAPIAFACDEECKPGEVYSDKQELCVPAPPPPPKPKPLT